MVSADKLIWIQGSIVGSVLTDHYSGTSHCRQNTLNIISTWNPADQKCYSWDRQWIRHVVVGLGEIGLGIKWSLLDQQRAWSSPHSPPLPPSSHIFPEQTNKQANRTDGVYRLPDQMMDPSPWCRITHKIYNLWDSLKRTSANLRCIISNIEFPG